MWGMKLFGTMDIRGDGGRWQLALIWPMHFGRGRIAGALCVYRQIWLGPFVLVWRIDYQGREILKPGDRFTIAQKNL